MGVKGAYNTIEKVQGYEKVEGSLRDAIVRCGRHNVFVDVYCTDYNTLRRLCSNAYGEYETILAVDKFLDMLHQKYVVET